MYGTEFIFLHIDDTGTIGNIVPRATFSSLRRNVSVHFLDCYIMYIRKYVRNVHSTFRQTSRQLKHILILPVCFSFEPIFSGHTFIILCLPEHLETIINHKLITCFTARLVGTVRTFRETDRRIVTQR